jgi:toxin ParE1/3/4
VGRTRVEKRPQAVQDLWRIAAYLVDMSRSAGPASRFLKAAETSFQALAEMPLIGASREYSNPDLAGIRMWQVKGFENYLIFYRTTVAGIEVVRVLHARRDIESILGKR